MTAILQEIISEILYIIYNFLYNYKQIIGHYAAFMLT